MGVDHRLYDQSPVITRRTKAGQLSVAGIIYGDVASLNCRGSIQNHPFGGSMEQWMPAKAYTDVKAGRRQMGVRRSAGGLRKVRAKPP